MEKCVILNSLCTFIIIISISAPYVNNADLNYANTDNSSKFLDTKFNNNITGNSFLNITSPIIINSELNASWFSEISILESYGTDLLPNQPSGIRNQIDEYMGNNDGIITISEINNFSELIISSRNWTNSFLGGCCAFDYIPLITAENNIMISPPVTGLVNISTGYWGWSESANLTGLTDNRISRIIDLPREGALIEEIPLQISLPKNWELRYSAMSEIINGEPNIFVITRSDSPVTSNIRITIGENLPPSLQASRYPHSSSSISLNGSTTFTSFCEDSILENPILKWEIRNNYRLVDTIQNSWFQLNPSEYDFSHGETASINLTCTDSHGINSSWSENIVIDGISPEWNGEISLDNGKNFINFNTLNQNLSVISGSEVMINISASDESLLPTSIELMTNISEGWRQFKLNEGEFSFTVSQGSGINGLHLNLMERHLQKESSEIGMWLVVTDDAGNSVTKEWKIEITDGNPPTILMDIMANNSFIELDKSAREGDTVQLIFSNSYDDLDSINKTSWQIYLDGDIILINTLWSEEVEKLTLPSINLGFHEITVVATDSSGNSRTEIFPLTIFPKKGVDLEVISQKLTGDLVVGGDAIYTLHMKNNGFDDAYARACISDICSKFVNFPGAEIDSTTTSIIEYDLIIPSDSELNISIVWNSLPTNNNGNFYINYDFEPKEDNDLSFVFLLLIIIIPSIFILRNSILIKK
jgi:hypothetical protein